MEQFSNSQLLVDYLTDCKLMKCLDQKTRKAYNIDIKQLFELLDKSVIGISAKELETVFGLWHEQFKPKTVKRKIASIKAFFHWLEEKEYIEENPFQKIHTRFREPKTLPKTIPEHNLELFLQEIYKEYKEADETKKKKALRTIVVFEFLFSTGVRISELCGLKVEDVNLIEGNVLIHGKGRKERMIQIPDEHLLALLTKYYKEYEEFIKENDGFFFINDWGKPLSDQSVRRMIEKYSDKAGISQHITPHMFRHTFATSLLESDVNLRCIQELLGHSSISTTEIYTHVSAAKQRQVLSMNSPRKKLNIEV